jgi:hypothetical protein
VPDLIVLTTAPGYLSWACPPPELDVPQALAAALEHLGTALILIGPHASTSPRMVLRELPAEVAVMGEPEQVLPKLAAVPLHRWLNISSVALRLGSRIHVEGFPYAVDMTALPPLRWPREMIERHRHRHGPEASASAGLGAEIESSRGCNQHCAFCARPARDEYLLVDRRGVGDHVFLLRQPLLEGLPVAHAVTGGAHQLDVSRGAEKSLLKVLAKPVVDGQGNDERGHPCRNANNGDRCDHADNGLPPLGP